MSNALLPVDQDIEIPSGKIVSRQTIFTIAERFWRIYPQPKKKEYQLTKEDCVVAVEVAMSRRWSPLAVGKEFFVWKGSRGELCFQEHYAIEVNWAQDKDKFTPRERMLSADEKQAVGIPEEDFVAEITLLLASRERDYQARYKMILELLLKSGIDTITALDIADLRASEVYPSSIGRVKHNEVFYENGKVRYGGAGDITGWVPGESRAKIRALRNVIHKAFGVPTTMELIKGGYLTNPPVEGMEALANAEEMVGAPAWMQAKYAKMAAAHEKSIKELEAMTPEERKEYFADTRELLHGPPPLDEADLGEVWEKEEQKSGPDVKKISPEEVRRQEEIRAELEAEDLEDAIFEELPSRADSGDSGDGYEAPVEFAEPAKALPVVDALSPGAVRGKLSELGLETAKAQDSTVAKLYPDRTIADLNEVELYNLIGYVQRRNILHRTKDDDEKPIPIPERFASIPEIAKSDAWPKTLEEAKERLTKHIQIMSGKGRRIGEVDG